VNLSLCFRLLQPVISRLYRGAGSTGALVRNINGSLDAPLLRSIRSGTIGPPQKGVLA
jgi:hypothetical protein